MQHLPLLERLFPTGGFVHLIRDGRDAALSFLAVPPGIMTEGWGHPRDARGFACQWATEVRAARALGARVGAPRYLEVRYETLVADPEAELRHVCRLAALVYDDEMLGYVGRPTPPARSTSSGSNEPPRVGVRDWRTEMAAGGRDCLRGGRGRSARRARLPGLDRRARPAAARRVRGEDPGVARRRRGHAALAALAPPPPDPRGTGV